MPRYAAIDIGSNSTRMLAAEVTGDHTQILAADREVTRLGESVFKSGALDKEALDRVSEVLRRFAGEYRRHNVIGVRAVATSAVRDAKNQKEFLERASDAAGTPVEIISGREEARLIHLGVEHRWPRPRKKVLIIDIGGGSAEIISARDGHMVDAVSKPLGAVRLWEQFTQEDPPPDKALARMQGMIDERLASIVKRLNKRPVDRVIATSATAAAVVCAINRVTRGRRDSADRLRATTAQVRRFYQEICKLDEKSRARLTGIGPRRAQIIIPGAAVLLSALEAFGARNVYYSVAGVRDGIIADLAARKVGDTISHLTLDQRKEVERASSRYGVQKDHARHVAALAHRLFAELQPLHGLSAEQGRLLEAAAYLHDVGHYVNDTAHHKHSYYIVANSDLSGFTARERDLLANLCRYHRKALPTAGHANLQALNPDERRALAFMIPLLRIADNLDRGHTQKISDLCCRIQDDKVEVRINAKSSPELEQWAAMQTAGIFELAYKRKLAVEYGGKA